MTAELVRLAAAIPIPVDGRGQRARAYCTVDPAGHRVLFAVDGGLRNSAPVGPAFPKPRQACDLAALLNGETPTPRSAPDPIPASADGGWGKTPAPSPDQEPIEAPAAASPVAGVPDRLCAECGGPLDPGSRRHRITCSRTCRVARSRRARGHAASLEDGRGVDSGTAVVTLSGPSTGEPSGEPGGGPIPPSALRRRPDQLALPLAAH